MNMRQSCYGDTFPLHSPQVPLGSPKRRILDSVVGPPIQSFDSLDVTECLRDSQPIA